MVYKIWECTTFVPESFLPHDDMLTLYTTFVYCNTFCNFVNWAINLQYLQSYKNGIIASLLIEYFHSDSVKIVTEFMKMCINVLI